MTTNLRPELEQIAVHTITNGMQVITISDIIYLKSDHKKTIIRLKNSEEVFASKSIGEFEVLLKNNKFLRVHQSYIVNLEHLISIDKNLNRHYCLLNGNKIIPISVRKFRIIKDRLEY
jgi:two-component system LytT family response regulator|tara:strand:+ start:244 stop:597 length:354 start_codon:yes stop_codon:yes gene_type:complete